jgi:hypothetical protein
MSVHYFPFFLPSVRISNLPNDITEEALGALIPGFRSIEFVRCRRAGDPRTALVEVDSCERADQTVEVLNYYRIKDREMFVTRFTDELHIRSMRRHALYVSGFANHRDLRAAFSRFGPLFQAVQNDRFSIGVVQFFRRLDAAKAESDRALFTPVCSHVNIRDLSLLISEEQLIEILSRFGTVRDCTFRDMTEMHVLSVADVTYSQVLEADTCKAKLNSTTLGDSTVHVSCAKVHRMPEWKMSQRNRWVRLDSPAQFDRCREFGRVINWNSEDGILYVMFDTVDDPPRFVQAVGGRLITDREFVEKTGSRDLEIVMMQSVTQPSGKPQNMVIEIDPMPDNFSSQQLQVIAAEAGDFEIYNMPSLDNPLKSRALVYSTSKRLAGKLYAQLCDIRIDQELLKPRRLKAEDVKQPPQRQESPIDRYGILPVIVIDPLTDVLSAEKLTRVAEPFQNIEVLEEASAVVRGARRAIFKIPSSKDRKTLNQILLNTVVDEIPLKPQVVKTSAIPPSLSGFGGNV